MKFPKQEAEDAKTESILHRGWRYWSSLWSKKTYDRQNFVALLEDYSKHGLFDPNSVAMLQGVFHVNEMRVRDIMIPRSQSQMIAKDVAYKDVIDLLMQSGHSRFPVLDDKNEKAEGVLLAKDLLCYFQKNRPEDFDVMEHLRPPFIVPESKRLNVLLEEFKRSRNHIAIVVDEYGSVSGIVTIEDVLEQIVGDIADEHDVAEDQYILDHGHGDFSVKGITPVVDFNQHFSSNLDESSVATIGGLVIKALGHLPQNGKEVSIGKFVFTVVRADNRRIHLLKLRWKDF